MADSQKIAADTDAVTKSYLPLYEHFDFQCVAAQPVAGTGITVSTLKRSVQ